jgi:D-glycero-D-manno-heptose 1,7-bisphosphate phosphatase
MKLDLLKYGVTHDGFYYYPHRPDENCKCGKPRTGLFERAKRDHDVDLQHSFMFRVKLLDIDA